MEVEKKEKTSTKKTKNIDKGVTRYGVRECLDTNKKIMLGSGVLLIIIIIQFIFMFFFQDNIKYFVVDKNKKVSKLTHIDKDFTLTIDSVYSYAQRAVVSVLSLSYDSYQTQLANSKNYFGEKVYNQLIAQLNNSNYIPLMLKYHRVYYAVPTPDVYQIKSLGNKVFRIMRSFVITSLGDDGTSKKIVYYAIDIQLVKRTQMYYNGMKIVNIHQITGDTAINDLLNPKRK